MNNNPIISIVIPLYNKEKAISKTIYSALSQTFDDYEIVVVDDGSTDKSVDIVKAIHSDKIRLISKKNGGVSSARNRGIEEAKGQWIIFLDADDFLLPYALHILYNLVTIYSVNIGCANYYNFNKQGFLNKYIHWGAKGILNDICKEMFFARVFLRTGNCLICRKLLVENMFNEKLRRYEDLDFFLRVSRGQKVAVTDKPIMIYTHLYGNLARDFSDIDKDYLGCLKFEGGWKDMVYAQIINREHFVYPTIDFKKLYHRRLVFIIAKVLDVPVRIKNRLFRRLTQFNK